MKDNKTYAVIGLGRFGMAAAETLADADCDLMVIDSSEEKIQAIERRVTYAIHADVRENGILKKLGIQNCDVVIISVSKDLEASIIATMQTKDLGVPEVIVKAANPLHGRIVSKMGADKVIYPEKAMGIRVARNLQTTGFVDYFELSDKYSLAEYPIPREWEGKSMSDIKVRQKYGLNIIGIKMGEEVKINIDPDEPLPAGCIILAAGENDKLEALVR